MDMASKLFTFTFTFTNLVYRCISSGCPEYMSDKLYSHKFITYCYRRIPCLSDDVIGSSLT